MNSYNGADGFLRYERHDRKGFNSGNNYNGRYPRSFDTTYGQLNLKILSDCNGDFTQQTLLAYDRRSDTLEETVIQLYRKGITTAEIADMIEKMYGAQYTHLQFPISQKQSQNKSKLFKNEN